MPTIKALRGKAESIRASELEKSLNKLGDTLTNKQKKVRAGVVGAWGAAAGGAEAAAVASCPSCSEAVPPLRCAC